MTVEEEIFDLWVRWVKGRAVELDRWDLPLSEKEKPGQTVLCS